MSQFWWRGNRQLASLEGLRAKAGFLVNFIDFDIILINFSQEVTMRKVIAVLTASTLLAGAGFAAAQSTSRIDERQEKLDKRIDKGVASGKITQKEAARLEKGQAHVEKMENRALKDGKLTKQEKRRIEDVQDQQSKRIEQERKDKQKN